MLLMTVFGGAALLLAAIGIYGLMAYSVQQRTQEIGIRLALGARPARCEKMVVVQGMLLALVGVGDRPGVGASALRGSSRRSCSASGRDPVVFVAAPLVLDAGGAARGVDPGAARASRVDPMDALRYE